MPLKGYTVVPICFTHTSLLQTWGLETVCNSPRKYSFNLISLPFWTQDWTIHPNYFPLCRPGFMELGCVPNQCPHTLKGWQFAQSGDFEKNVLLALHVIPRVEFQRCLSRGNWNLWNKPKSPLGGSPEPGITVTRWNVRHYYPPLLGGQTWVATDNGCATTQLSPLVHPNCGCRALRLFLIPG